jgi:proline dehydrogenase
MMLNQLIIKMMPLIPKAIIHQVAKKYIAGDELSDAVRVTKDFAKMGGMTTVDVLGEFVSSRERALHEKEMSSLVIDAIIENKLPTYLSVKPTSLGLGIDFDFAYNNIKELLTKANEHNIFLRIDMENAPYTTSTLELYKKFRAEGFDNVGFVVQAYMFRSMEDIKALAEYKPNARLCKGIYKESPQIAFQNREEVRDNYKKLLDYMLDNGYYTGIATHDDVLIDYAYKALSKRGMKHEEYEFQMLLGVREEKRNSILKDGHRMRIYVPFGKDWYGYSSRRLKENPNMAGYIFKAMFFKG